MTAIDELLADYDHLRTGEALENTRWRDQNTQKVKELVEVVVSICRTLVKNEQPNPRRRCSYCNTAGHAPFCIVSAAQETLKRLNGKKR